MLALCLIPYPATNHAVIHASSRFPIANFPSIGKKEVVLSLLCHPSISMMSCYTETGLLFLEVWHHNENR